MKDIIIIYTGDVHCGIEENIGYAGLAAYKKAMEEKTPYVTLVDCGDALQGEFIGLTSEGGYIVDIMNRAGYDFMVPGNHEFDYGMERFGKLMKQSTTQFLSCNLTYTGERENVLLPMKPYEIVQYGEVTVGFVGVTTPESISTAPTSFVEDGQYVYDFAGDDNGKELYDCIQKYVDECRQQGADYVVLLAHLGAGEAYSPFSSEDVAKATEGIDIILDGHSHSILPCKKEFNKQGKEVLISSTGTKFANIGKLVIGTDGSIDTELITDYSQKDTAMEQYINEIQTNFEEKIQKQVGFAQVKLSAYSEDGIRLVRSRETNIGNFCADAYRYVAGADIGLLNGGGIRADFPIGKITYEDLFVVHPFGNTLCMVKATGQEILDCLEMSCRDVLPQAEKDGNAIGEDGGFQQVSGLKFTIDTSVIPSILVDENDMFVSVEGERRIKNVKVLNKAGEYEPLKADAVYTVAARNFFLKEGGNGCGMFTDNELLINETMTDYQVLVTYLTEKLGGIIDSRYAGTEGRITVL